MSENDVLIEKGFWTRGVMDGCPKCLMKNDNRHRHNTIINAEANGDGTFSVTANCDECNTSFTVDSYQPRRR